MARKYYGEEFGQIKRLKPGHPKMNTIDDVYTVLRKAWSKETAYPSCQSEWVPSDPSYGQCAVTAMLVHDMFGGTIHRIRVSGGGTHYFNMIAGHYIDLPSSNLICTTFLSLMNRTRRWIGGIAAKIPTPLNATNCWSMVSPLFCKSYSNSSTEREIATFFKGTEPICALNFRLKSRVFCMFASRVQNSSRFFRILVIRY